MLLKLNSFCKSCTQRTVLAITEVRSMVSAWLITHYKSLTNKATTVSSIGSKKSLVLFLLKKTITPLVSRNSWTLNLNHSQPQRERKNT